MSPSADDRSVTGALTWFERVLLVLEHAHGLDDQVNDSLPNDLGADDADTVPTRTKSEERRPATRIEAAVAWQLAGARLVAAAQCRAAG